MCKSIWDPKSGEVIFSVLCCKHILVHFPIWRIQKYVFPTLILLRFLIRIKTTWRVLSRKIFLSEHISKVILTLSWWLEICFCTSPLLFVQILLNSRWWCQEIPMLNLFDLAFLFVAKSLTFWFSRLPKNFCDFVELIKTSKNLQSELKNSKDSLRYSTKTMKNSTLRRKRVIFHGFCMFSSFFHPDRTYLFIFLCRVLHKELNAVEKNMHYSASSCAMVEKSLLFHFRSLKTFVWPP